MKSNIKSSVWKSHESLSHNLGHLPPVWLDSFKAPPHRFPNLLCSSNVLDVRRCKCLLFVPFLFLNCSNPVRARLRASMAKMGTLFFFLFLVARLVHSRLLSEIPRTSFLDVAASIENTKRVFTFPVAKTTAEDGGLEQEEARRFSGSSKLSLRLQSRISLQKLPHSDYKSLTLARLERDSARVRSLTARVDLAVRGIKAADLMPMEDGGGLQFREEELEGPIVSGASQGSGEYFSRLGIGRPASPVYMVLDTGSDVNWVQCAPCADCYQQADPIFQPASSTSFSPLSCETQQCQSLEVSQCRNGTCLYEVSYGDGSYTVGDFVTETISLGSTSVDNIAIGCGHNNEGLFVGAAGLLGLGGGPLSFPSQLKTTSFSYCLVDRDSQSASTLEFGSSIPPNAVTAPLQRNPVRDTFYYLGVTGLSVGGEQLQLPDSSFNVDGNGNGGIIIDSGTAVTRLPTVVYNTLRDAFVKGTTNLRSTTGVSLFDTCYDLSSKTSVEVPTVAFNFVGGKVLKLPAKNYLIPVDSAGTFCFAFAPTASSLGIIGNVQQQGTRVSFNLADSLIGFSPNGC